MSTKDITTSPSNFLYSHFPQELKTLNNWVCFRNESKSNGETQNRPYAIDGTPAKSNDSSTWSPFADAVNASPNHKFSGISFMLLGTPYLGFDFDGVVKDGFLDSFVAAILQLMGDPYAEVSFSGEGLRVFVECPDLPRPTQKTQFKDAGHGVEIYYGGWAGKALTVTGSRYSGKEVTTISPERFELVLLLCSQIHDEKFRKLWLGDTSDYKADDSRADLALCRVLARLLDYNVKKIDAAFRCSKLMRDKWQRKDYRERTIAKAISGHTPKGEPIEAPRDEIDDEKQAVAITAAYPSDTIGGDLIGELTRALTNGTFIPPQFMRENIKVALGSIMDGFVGFPNHEDLHTREYLHNVSVYPQSGKGESFKRSIAYPTGFLSELLKKFGVTIIDGGLFGSGEFMVKILKDAPTHRSIARFDEMSEVWSKNRALGCTLEKKLLTLFESTSAAQGSFKNGVHADSDFHVSVVGDFTKDSFDASFTGSGSRGSGYLSRCIFQFADKQPLAGDWQLIDTEKVRHILSDIEARLTEILSHDGPFIPTESTDLRSCCVRNFTRGSILRTLDTSRD